MESTITEILGGIIYGTGQQMSQSRPTLSSTIGAQINQNAPHMYAWQLDIVNQLKSRDLLIATSSPGGGKTLPVFVYWTDELLNLNTRQLYNNPTGQFSHINFMLRVFGEPDLLPKILWCTPFRSLNDQTFSDFMNSFIQLFLQIVNLVNLNWYQKKGNPQHSINKDLIQFIDILCYNLPSSMRTEFVQKLNVVYNTINQIQPQSENAKQQIEKLKQELFRIYENIAVNYIKTRLIGNVYQGENTAINPVTHRIKPVVVAIYESAPSIIEKYESGSLRLLVFDEIQRVFLSESGRQDYDVRAKQIAKAIDEILKSEASNKTLARLVLLSGTISPEMADQLTHFYNKKYNRNFPETTKLIDAKNPATITVKSLNTIRTEDGIIQEIKHCIARRQKGTVFMLFNKEQIRRITQQLASGYSPDTFTQQKVEVGSSSNQYYKPEHSSIISGQLDASQITDPLLRKAVHSKFGFTYSLQPTDINYYPQIQQDNQIVQELFKHGKIYVLLATDNIEAGMNIKILHLYIPKFVKMKEPIPIASASQILHRVGRDNVNAYIYTPEEFVHDVETALRTTSKDFPVTQIATP